KAQTATIDRNLVKAIVKVNDKNIKVNDYLFEMDTKAIVKDDRLFLPVRYLSEMFGYMVNWDSKTSTISLIPNTSLNAYSSTFFPTPTTGHPRLLITKQYIPIIKQRIASNDKLKKVWTDTVSKSKTTSSNLDEMRIIAESNAFLYLLENDKDAGLKAVDLTLKILSKADQKASYEEYNDSQNCGRIILGASIVYDWCYNLLDSTNKTKIISTIESLASKMEVDYSPSAKWGSLTGHAVGNPLLRDLLSAGIAIYDEKKDMYNKIASWVFSEVIPSRDFIYKSGFHPMGDSYGPSRFQCEMFTSLIFRRMGWINIFSKDQQNIAYSWIYTRRPDGQYLRDGDSFIGSYTPIGKDWTHITSLMLTASYYINDPYIQKEFYDHYEANSSDPTFELLFANPVSNNYSYNDLPLTRYFSSPAGYMVARTGWDKGFNSSAVVAEMKVGVYQFNNHQHLDAGSFELYYKGALAIDSGLYEGDNGGYRSAHDLNYHKRTIAHNSMLVYYPNEVFQHGNNKITNDGGQFFPNKGIEPFSMDELTDKYKVSDVLAYQFGPDNMKPDFSYLKGNLTEAYTDKVKDYKRSFMFLNLKNDQHPAALIIYDNITSSDKSFKKSWLLHSIEKPAVSNNVTTIGRTTNGYTGKLVNHTLLPAQNNLKINVIGGSGNEFLVNGKNYPNSVTNSRNSIESGSWRIEVSPANASENDRFLNVLQVMDSTTSPLSVEKIDSNLFVGAKLLNKVVLFSKSGNTVSEAVEFEIGSSKEIFQIIVADLEQGSWSVERDGTKVYDSLTSTKNGNTLCFNGKSGKYKLTKLN
ncbi:MAG: DUF4962 domain-containing protein, partial [Clostridiaceae bacterium]|nr:DUF4962 domain-containing protein [Clostridiaceae bacterium]